MAFWEGGYAAATLPTRGALVVGRSRTADLSIDHPSVSREHARIVVDANISIVDLGSHNGTRVGSVVLRAGERAVVAPGDVIDLGGAFLSVQSTRPTGEGRPERETLDALIERVSRSDLSVILLGETGVGKDVTAERIHRASPRAGGPLVSLNCAALSESLLESELFGHERGAFTGAHGAKVGLLEAGHRGTVFFDEVAELPLSTQAKLLRAIETRTILRVGSVVPKPIDVRFVAATNRPLEELVASGAFRRDLYFRLAGLTLRIPPLRARLFEIPALARLFLTEASARHGRSAPNLSNASLAALRAHAWPGNVRELKNVMERALVLCSDAVIEPQHLLLTDAGLRAPSTGSGDFDDERARVLGALEQAGGNQTRAAKLLGISRRTLVNRLDQYNLPRPRKL
ncbi:MAG: sigma 54-interacting transcriptional regulator [Polyangiaceae bacterium]|nr:sigma 54-interacting transcriptional regulator [Polyangiaceae bacterium]